MEPVVLITSPNKPTRTKIQRYGDFAMLLMWGPSYKNSISQCANPDSHKSYNKNPAWSMLLPLGKKYYKLKNSSDSRIVKVNISITNMNCPLTM